MTGCRQFDTVLEKQEQLREPTIVPDAKNFTKSKTGQNLCDYYSTPVERETLIPHHVEYAEITTDQDPKHQQGHYSRRGNTSGKKKPKVEDIRLENI